MIECLILCSCHTGGLSCCEFMSFMFLLCQEDNIFLWPFPSSGSYNVSIPIYCVSPWAMEGESKRGREGRRKGRRDRRRERGKEAGTEERRERERVPYRHPGFCVSTLLTLILQVLTSCGFLCHCTKKFLWTMRVVLITLKIWCNYLLLIENMLCLFSWVWVSSLNPCHLGPCIYLETSSFQFSLQLNNIPLYVGTTFSLATESV